MAKSLRLQRIKRHLLFWLQNNKADTLGLSLKPRQKKKEHFYGKADLDFEIFTVWTHNCKWLVWFPFWNATLEDEKPGATERWKQVWPCCSIFSSSARWRMWSEELGMWRGGVKRTGVHGMNGWQWGSVCCQPSSTWPSILTIVHTSHAGLKK